MTLLEIGTSELREGSIPVLETERLILRAPRLGDAKALAALANDKRIAENTAPHSASLQARRRRGFHQRGRMCRSRTAKSRS